MLDTLRQAASQPCQRPGCSSMSCKDKAEMEGEDALGWKDESNPWGLFASRRWNQADSKTTFTTSTLFVSWHGCDPSTVEMSSVELMPFQSFCKALDACKSGADEGQSCKSRRKSVRKAPAVNHDGARARNFCLSPHVADV